MPRASVAGAESIAIVVAKSQLTSSKVVDLMLSLRVVRGDWMSFDPGLDEAEIRTLSMRMWRVWRVYDCHTQCWCQALFRCVDGTRSAEWHYGLTRRTLAVCVRVSCCELL